ncbi:hypothetical protein BDQ17DRAFT_1429632 [Cyathus striatus]|nr:hypothetical protein BDQ17DRAFT_1429632 [Cyathus striatus]
MLSILTLASILSIVTLNAQPSIATAYGLVKDYLGDSLFEGWDFFDGFQLQVTKPGDRHAFLKVDAGTIPDNEKCNSVRITTTASYDFGSIWVTDVYHAPYGCGVWPAIWSWTPQVSYSWPAGGEIDTFEAVNQVIYSHASLHTLPGCKASSLNSNQSSSSVVNSTDCNGADKSGCIVTDTGHPSYGPNFNNGGGGVFVTEFTSAGISTWFFPRADVPGSISSNSSTIDTSTLHRILQLVSDYEPLGTPLNFTLS